MSRDLDEQEVLDDVFDVIRGYGRKATFYSADESETWPWYISPPKENRILEPGGTAPEDSHRSIVAAKGIPFEPKRMSKMVDSKDSSTWRIVGADPIDSGLLTAAWRIRLAR